METFIQLRDLVANPGYRRQREKCLGKLDYRKIDPPLVELIRNMTQLDYCFPMQCCYGHFLYGDQKDQHNIEPLPVSLDVKDVQYRIAYIAFCIEENDSGKDLIEALKAGVSLAPGYIQFGCASWFWERQVNSYALQVEPERFMLQDTAVVDGQEALRIEEIRNRFFPWLEQLIRDRQF